MKDLTKSDLKLATLIKQETKRQQDGLVLIASENFVSPAVLEALGSPLTNKYSEGYPGRRYYGGNQFIDQVENLAIERAKKLFLPKSEWPNWQVNVQPYSGSPANFAVYAALLETRINADHIRGLTRIGMRINADQISADQRGKNQRKSADIMGMALAHGGHLTHGHKVSFSGKFFTPIQYHVSPKNHLIDFDEIEKLAEQEKPKIIVCGYTAYPRIIDFKKFGEIAKKIGAILMADIAHIAGLIAAGVHPSPFPYADVVTTTTHKTLRGPRGAMIFARNEYAEAINKAVFPGLQGGPHDNNTAAMAVAFGEALKPSFKKYAQQIVKNAKALAESLKKQGFKLITDGTDNHLILVDLTSTGVTGKEVEKMLEDVGIYVNRNTIPYDPRSPFDPSGIRLGTPALTTRGLKEKEMKKIGEILAKVVLNPKSAKIKKEVKSTVINLTKKFPLYSKF